MSSGSSSGTPQRPFWLLLGESFIAATIFMLLYYGTVNQTASLIYFGFTFGWGLLLLELSYRLKNRVPFLYANKLPLSGSLLGILVVPVVFFLAQVVEYLTSTRFTLLSGSWPSSFLPEVISKLVGQQFSFLPNLPLLESVLLIPGWVQTIAWQLGAVAPAEEMFRVGAIELVVLGVYWKLNKGKETATQKKISKWIPFAVMILITLLWTAMHGILSYSSLSEFVIAWLAGNLFLTVALVYESLLPAVLGHGVWNILGSFSLLTMPIMVVFFVVIFVLWFVAFWRERAKKRQG